MRGKKCIRFPSLSKEECPRNILIVEIKGLGLAQDLNPNSSISGYVIFSQSKNIDINESSLENNENNENEDATISIHIR